MSMLSKTALEPLFSFLKTSTDEAWVGAALENMSLLLIDHAQCERKAASTALQFMSKYPKHLDIVSVMSPLAREELLHFEKVMAIIKEKNIKFTPLKPSRYAKVLHDAVDKTNDNIRLAEELIVGAIIEARSCERFCALLPALKDKTLAKFYQSLVRSEARHFEDYLKLAHRYHPDVEARSKIFLAIENEYIASQDACLRFHSGIPG